MSSLSPSPTDSVSLYMNVASVAALPAKASRRNTQSRYEHLGSNECVVVVCTPQDMYASGCAVARAYSAYTRKTVGEPPSAQPRPVREVQVKVEFLLVDGETDPAIPANLTESALLAGETGWQPWPGRGGGRRIRWQMWQTIRLT